MAAIHGRAYSEHLPPLPEKIRLTFFKERGDDNVSKIKSQDIGVISL